MVALRRARNNKNCGIATFLVVKCHLEICFEQQVGELFPKCHLGVRFFEIRIFKTQIEKLWRGPLFAKNLASFAIISSAESPVMSTFTARGLLGQIPAGTWANGGTRRAYLDIGSQRYDDCWVADYFESSLTECMGTEVELSFCRLDKNGGNHLCAIKHADGKIEKVPAPDDVGFTHMLVAGLLWGGITFLTTWLVIPVFLIPIWLLSKIGIDSETVLGSVTFGGLSLCWMAQLIWVLFYSKKLSPKVRLRTIKAARAAFD